MAQQHIGNVEKWFDSTADYWDELYASGKAADKILVERKDLAVGFASKFLKPGQRILDAGCGAGVVAMELVRRNFVVHGVDVSEKMIQLCRKNFQQANVPQERYQFTVGNLDETQLPAGSFDAILALGFLEYQPDENALLQTFHRLLSPGGILIVTGPNDQTAAGKTYNKARRLLKRVRRKIMGGRPSAARGPGSKPGSAPPRISLNTYTVARFRNLLRSNRFSLIEHRRHGYDKASMLSKLLGLAKDIVVVAKKQSTA